MFAVVDVGGLQTPYVAGVFRDRKVTKVSKTLAMQPVGQENQAPHKGYSSFRSRLYEEAQDLLQGSPSTIVARDIMASPVVTLSLHASLAMAWDLVRTKRFRHIPILSPDGALVGILSDRDLSRGTVEAAVAGTKGSDYLAKITIEPYVIHPVLVATPEATLLAIARVLLEERIGAIPIVSQEKELLGMITRSDILRVIVTHPNFEEWG